MKNTLLKILLAILIFALSFTLFACGANDDGDSTQNPPPNEEVQLQVIEGSKGLSYEVKKSGGKKYAICTGIGTCTDTDIIISSHYDGAVVTEIKSQAFKGNKKIKSVKFSNGLEEIGMYAFNGCTSLFSVTLPKSVTNIMQNAFYNCTNLFNICNDSNLDLVIGTSTYGDIANNACNIYNSNSGADGVFKTVGDYEMFEFSNNLFILKYNGDVSSFAFPDGVTGLSKDLFRETDITTLNLPASVAYIGKNAFYNCASLKSVNVPANSKLERVGENAFMGCEALTEFNFGSTIYDYLNIDFATAESNPLYYSKTLKIDGKTPTDIVIPNGIKVIKPNLFTNCLDIKSVTLSPTVEELQVSVFQNCTNLEAFNIQPDGNLKKLGFGAFRYCTSLRKLEFPISVEEIGMNVFEGCNSIQTIDFANNSKIKTVGEEAFKRCTSLGTVFFGHNSALETVGKNAFQYCSNLCYFRLGNYSTIKELGYGALQGCKSLKELYVPKSCTIGYVCLSGLFYGTRDGGAYCTIYLEVEEIPVDYANWFNPSNCPVELGVPYPVEKE